MPNNKGLCFRCEHRADFFETGRRPRYECGCVNKSVNGCYAYKPVKPIVIERASYEKALTKETGISRPMRGPWSISSRCDRSETEIDMIISYYQINEDELFLYWQPKSEIEEMIKGLKGE